jgi:hypothetical protein
MGTITHAQLQELVTQLPEEQLAAAHDLLLRLTKQRRRTAVKQFGDFGGDAAGGQGDMDKSSAGPGKATATTPTEFMLLPLRERRRLMEKQAAYMTEYYEQTATERTEWQAGEFIDDPAE